jgi:hypothetical protein
MGVPRAETKAGEARYALALIRAATVAGGLLTFVAGKPRDTAALLPAPLLSHGEAWRKLDPRCATSLGPSFGSATRTRAVVRAGLAWAAGNSS